MAYAELAAVKGRAGRLARAWTATSEPGDPDLERFLDQTAGELDALFSSQGIAVPIENTEAIAALEGINADAALMLALTATWPGGAGGAQVQDLRNEVKARITSAMSSIADGGFPALQLLLTGRGSGEGANNFWTKEPTYGRLGTITIDELFQNPGMRPQVFRDSKF